MPLIKERVLTRAITSTSSNYCGGGISSFDKVTENPTKTLLFFFVSNKLADPLGLELLDL